MNINSSVSKSGVATGGADTLPTELVFFVPDFPQFNYSMTQVSRAGEALSGELIWTSERVEEIHEIFRIANNWRDSHALPMRKLRYELLAQIRKHDLQGITVARLKRMQSIRKKLTLISAKLNQIQDLGGCRAILPSIGAVRHLVEVQRQNSAHILHNEGDYISNPKPGGYRSHHLIFKFQGVRDEEAYSGRRIELQIRTRLQHAWATAVEAVGLFLGEDLKGGQGSAEWLRLFELMSAELALAEQCPEPANLPARNRRVVEIVELDRKLQAANTLENLRHAVRFTDSYLQTDLPKYYLIQYDNSKNSVEVKPFNKPISGTDAYDKAELKGLRAEINKFTTVLVEADKIENLKEAYPNYFGDVQLFYKNLKAITKGGEATEYTMPPQATVPPPPREAPDLSWFRKHRRWR